MAVGTRGGAEWSCYCNIFIPPSKSRSYVFGIPYIFLQLRFYGSCNNFISNSKPMPRKLSVFGIQSHQFERMDQKATTKCNTYPIYSCFKVLFQPVLHDWCNKGRGMYYAVCGMMHIKEPFLLIGKSSPCGGSGFPLSLSEWSFTICLTPYNRK